MKQFCKSVLQFLESEYSDAYKFEISHSVNIATSDKNNQQVELIVKVSPNYTLKIINTSMQYLFCCYRTGEFIEERGQYRWQKELIDMIEGG